MAQKGIMSFFSKSPAPSKASNKPRGSASPHTNGSTNDDGVKEPLADSPILRTKSKRKRVIIDSSDDDEDQEGGVVDTNGSLANGSGLENGTKNGTSTPPPTTPTSISGNNVATPASASAARNDTTPSITPASVAASSIATPLSVAGSSTDGLTPKTTPPRRKTALKHTGKVRRTICSPSASVETTPITAKVATPSPKRPKISEEDVEEKGVDVNEGMAGGVVKMAEQDLDKEEAGTEEKMEVDVQSPSPHGQQKAEKKSTASKGKKKAGKSTKGKSKAGSAGSGKKAAFFAPKVKKVKQVEEESTEDTKMEEAVQSATAAKEVVKKGKEAGEVYNPAGAKYHPLEDACWQKGQKVPYLALARTFERIEEESKRLKIISILTNFFRSVFLLSPDEMVSCVYLCLNKLAPAYEGLELGIGESVLMKAIAGATGRSVQQIKADAVEKGDLGLVAETSRSNQRTMFAPPKLMVSSVFKKLRDIASMSGNASMSRKVDIIKGLFVACRHSEARYLIRSLGGKLRIGLAEQSVLVALGHAVVQSPPSQEWPPEVVDSSKEADYQKRLEEAVLIIKSCYCEHPDYGKLIPALIDHGISSLPDHCHLTPGIPLKPMLAHPTKGVQEVLHRFESADFTCEWKYDGERAQVHVMEGGETRVYSRNSENNTSKYPDIIARMPMVLKDTVKSCVIDSEAVAWDVETQQILPFQVLSTRKRKDAEVSEIKVQVCLYAFDLLYLNGKSLVKEPFKVRRELLQSSFNEIDGEFKIATSMDTSNVEEIQEFLEGSIKGNCEGLMVKTLEKNATYEIAKRSHNWLKLKKDYLEGVGDTLDLVVVGGFHGSGKRTGRYGGFLLACYDEESEEYQVICKIGTGFKDDELESHAQFFRDHVIDAPKAYYRHTDGVKPDHWFDAVQVWEVKAADLSISPVYTAAAGIVDPEKGISLRFPRFLRVREDKKPEEATSSEQVAAMYKRQQNVNKSSSGVNPDPEEFY